MNLRTRNRAGAFAVALAMAGALLAPTQAHAAEGVLDDVVTFDHGHIDAFNVMLDDANRPLLVLNEDVTGAHVKRTAEAVELFVKPETLRPNSAWAFPASLPVPFYHLPYNQNQNFIWPGWDTNGLKPVYGNDVDTGIEISAVDGPGQIWLWYQTDEGAQSSLDGGGFTLPATIRQGFPSHTHTAWGFTAPGTYKVTAQAHVAGNGLTASSNVATYTFVVGERTELTPEAPVQDGGTVTIPAQSWVDYRDGDGNPLPAGQYALGDGETLAVSATPALGFDLAEGAAASWSFEYEAPVVQAVAITGLSHHYHQGSPILLQAVPSPLVEGATFEWFMQRADQPAPVRFDGVTGQNVFFPAEQALDGATVTARMLAADGVTELAVAPAVTIDVDDHGAAPFNEVTVSGAADHYHTGDTANLVASVSPLSVLNRWVWETRLAGEAEWTEVGGQHGHAYSFEVTEELEGASVRARLTFDDGAPYVESAPGVIEIDDHHGEEPVETSLSISGLAHHYHTGDVANLSAVQDPETGEDHYHWFVKRAGEAGYTVIPGELTANLAHLVAEGDDGAEIIVRLYDHDHEVIAESAPVVIEIDDHHGEEPVETSLSISGLAHHYHTGDVANLSAVQDPETGEDHYHWFVKRAGDEGYTVIPGELTANLAYTVTAEDAGAQIIVRLYDHDHGVIAESAPATIAIDDHHGGDHGDEKPGQAPARPDASALDGVSGGIALDRSSVTQGGTVTVQVGEGDERAGEWVAAWMFSTPALLGSDWQQVAANGTITVRIPADTTAGAHRIAVFDSEGALIGWQPIAVTAASSDTGTTGPGTGGTTGGLATTGSELPLLAVGGAALLLLAAGAVLMLRRRGTTEG